MPLMHQDYVLEPVALALGGGGSVGDFQLGALDFIHTQFMGTEEATRMGFGRPRFDIVTGTSVGAVNAGALAQGAAGSMEELKRIWFLMSRTDNFYVFNKVIEEVLGDIKSLDRIIRAILLSGQKYSSLVAQTSIMNPAPLARICTDIDSYWSPCGPGLRGAGLSVARDLRGHRLIFARGYDDLLYVRTQLDGNSISESTRWSMWKSLGGPISSDPVAFHTSFIPAPADNPVRAGVIARLANEEQYGGRTLDNFDNATRVDSANSNYDPFQPWVNIPPPPQPDRHYSSQPTVIPRSPDGRAWAFCRDESHLVSTPWYETHRSFFSRWDGSAWETWRLFGQEWMNFAGNITGCSYLAGDSVLELFTYGKDGRIWHNFTGAAPIPETGTCWMRW